MPASPVSPMFRSPRRISVTVPDAVYAYLQSCSDHQGRSLSNYAAHLLEQSMWQRLAAQQVERAR